MKSIDKLAALAIGLIGFIALFIIVDAINYLASIANDGSITSHTVSWALFAIVAGTAMLVVFGTVAALTWRKEVIEI